MGSEMCIRDRLNDSIVYSDPVLLARIIRNLLSNAIKFTPKGGTVNVSTVKTDHLVKIIIRDDGIGIAKSKQSEIFDEYVQLGNKNRDREQGLGLGLSIVQKLTLLLDINIELTSELEKGSSFTLSLPIHQTQIEPLPPKAGSTSFTFLTSPLIVVVDDDKDCLLYTSPSPRDLSTSRMPSSA